MARHNVIGNQGELLARKFLEEKGYEILDENWRFRKAEIDLIVYKNPVIVFVEVKTRENNRFADPEDFVTKAKQKLLAMAAGEYIHLMNHQNEVRFDIISILFNKFGDPIIRHTEDAFWP
jgi:putative endonuclease